MSSLIIINLLEKCLTHIVEIPTHGSLEFIQKYEVAEHLKKAITKYEEWKKPKRLDLKERNGQ